LTLSPSEESKEGKWSVIFPFLTQLIETSRDFREPLERSFDAWCKGRKWYCDAATNIIWEPIGQLHALLLALKALGLR
jgi:hypothetical protein